VVIPRIKAVLSTLQERAKPGDLSSKLPSSSTTHSNSSMLAEPLDPETASASTMDSAKITKIKQQKVHKAHLQAQ